ncbi:SPW repeat protein [Natrinema zhouii]|uniref:SPW repeat protein n=1 Tax=Natrinema zhouii TaxID=1710539 RepID=A0A7D6H2I8_9EURY|nr:SPW repeat protein [Natrinema zhouii]QLK25747.1 SPW repeat protein [Natrinema zhouii]
MSESATDDPTGESHARGQGEPAGQKWLSGFVSLIGLWLAVSPLVYETAESMLWNNLLIGGTIFLLAGYNYYRITNGHSTSIGVMSLAALLALWLAVSQWAIGGQFALSGLEIADAGLLWNNVVSGLVAAALSAYIAYAGGRELSRQAATGT